MAKKLYSWGRTYLYSPNKGVPLRAQRTPEINPEYEYEYNQKLILLADKSPYEWKTVIVYKHNDLAEDEEVEKKIYRAEARATRTSKRFAAPGLCSPVARYSQLLVAHFRAHFEKT